MPKRSPAPPGAFTEINLDLIGEGRFRQQFERHLRRAYKELVAYEKESGDGKGKAIILAKITLERTKGVKEHFNISYGCKTSVPTIAETAVVKERGEKLLCQPIGASEHDPDQQAFFDSQGNPITADGEPIEEPKDVAGSIKPAKQA